MKGNFKIVPDRGDLFGGEIGNMNIPGSGLRWQTRELVLPFENYPDNLAEGDELWVSFDNNCFFPVVVALRSWYPRSGWTIYVTCPVSTIQSVVTSRFNLFEPKLEVIKN